MSIRVLNGASRSMAVGSPWVMRFEVCDHSWPLAVADPPVVTVTLPDASTATPEVTVPDSWLYVWSSGQYEAIYTPLVSGRFTARAVTTANGVVDLLAVVHAVTVAMPTADDLDAWIGESEHSWTSEELEDALTAETSAQMRVCRVPASYPPDLREALLRRAARNLAMRRQLTAEPRGEGDVDLPAVLPVAADPEIRRLEKPFRRMPIG